MRQAVLALLLVLLAVVAGGCTTAPGEDHDAAADELTWSPLRLTLSRVEGGRLDPGDAYWMARLSALAYEDPTGLRVRLAQIGARGEFAFASNARTGTEAFFLGTPTHAILVFRGTQLGMTDLITDVRRSQRPTLFGRVHAGFYAAFRSVWEDGDPDLRIGGDASPGEGMRSFVLRRTSNWSDARPLLLAGHSLGAALATLAAVDLAYAGCHARYRDRSEALTVAEATLCRNATGPEGVEAPPERHAYRSVSGLYTFGAPRVGDARFGQIASALGWSSPRTFRFVNVLDPIVQLPYFGYWHPHVGEDEKAHEILLLGERTGHSIAAYSAALFDRVPTGHVIEDAPERTYEELFANRVVEAVRTEAVAWMPAGARSAYAERHRVKLAADGHTPETLQTTIDGVALDGVRLVIEDKGVRVVRLFVFEASGRFVCELGWIGDVAYADSTPP